MRVIILKCPFILSPFITADPGNTVSFIKLIGNRYSVDQDSLLVLTGLGTLRPYTNLFTRFSNGVDLLTRIVDDTAFCLPKSLLNQCVLFVVLIFYYI